MPLVPAPPAPRTLDPYAENPFVVRARPLLQTFVPGSRYRAARAGYDVEYAINGLGLRDDPMQDPGKAAGTFRVLFLGDSITEGYEGGYRVPLFRSARAAGQSITFVGGQANGPTTVMTWTLEGSGGKTRLTLVHSGFAPDAPTSGLQSGWLNFASWLKSMLEYGADWQPAIKRLTQDFIPFYPGSVGAAQADLRTIE